MFGASAALSAAVNVVEARTLGHVSDSTKIGAPVDVMLRTAGPWNEPVQYTGSEKVAVTVDEPVTPLALTKRGAIVSAAPVVNVALAGLVMRLPATSRT